MVRKNPQNNPKKKLTFSDSVYAVVRTIPKGKTLTYKDGARLAGSPKAFRAVGTVLSKNTNPKDIPCHRVIRSDGKVGGYFGDMSRSNEKRAKLVKEGTMK